MSTEQKELLREVLIDYLQVLTQAVPWNGKTDPDAGLSVNRRIAEVRLLLKEVA